MKKLLDLLAVLSLLLVLAPSVAFADGAMTVDLIAGQDMAVGSVTVDNDGTMLTATYQITDADWCLTETHLYVGTKAPKKAAPGQFPYGNDALECVQSATYHIPLSELGVEAGDTLYVAAHAVVESALLHGVPGTYTVHFPGANSYFDATFVTPGGETFSFPAYCVDLDYVIYSGRAYDAVLYSSLDPNAPVDRPENLDLVNYVLNTDYSALGAGPNEIQAVIWTLIEDITPSSPHGSISWNQAIVDQIVADAYANGEGFVPGEGDVIGYIFYIGNTQTTVAQTTLGEFPLGSETAWAQGQAFDGKGNGWAMYLEYVVQ